MSSNTFAVPAASTIVEIPKMLAELHGDLLGIDYQASNQPFPNATRFHSK